MERVKANPLEEALNYAKNVSTIKYTNKDNARENKLFGRAFEEAVNIFIHYKKPLLVLRCLKKLIRTGYCPFSIHFTTLKALAYCTLSAIQLRSTCGTPRPMISRRSSFKSLWRARSRGTLLVSSMRQPSSSGKSLCSKNSTI